MKTIAWIGAAALGLAACSGAPDRKTDEKTILQGERAWGGMLISGDAKAADQLLDDSFRGIGTSGQPYDKAAMLTMIRNGPHITADTVGPVKIAFYGDTAVAQGSEHEVGPAPDRRAADHIWTDVWVKRQGRWRIVAAEDLDPAKH